MKVLFLILFNFTAGTICVIYGVNMMSAGLEKANMRLMRKALSKFTGSVFTAMLTGTVLTAAVQSSTVITILTVGFVNSGLIALPQAIGIIYGANLGTTVTAQLMSFNVTSASLPILISGCAIRLISKRRTVQALGKAMAGLGFLFCGLNILNSGVPYIKESRFVYHLFSRYGANPVIGLFIGMVITMLVQSSSATVGLTIILFSARLVSFEAAVGLTLGDNIGTCLTTQLASFKAGIEGKQAAWAHTMYNIIGSITAMLLFTPFCRMVVHITKLLGQDETRLIANTHTIFNLLSAAAFYPFTRYYVRFIERLVPSQTPYTSRQNAFATRQNTITAHRNTVDKRRNTVKNGRA